MAIKRFRKVKTSTPELGEVQDNIADSLNPVLALPLSSSKFLPQQSFVSGPNLVSHGLGRKYLSCFFGPPSSSCSFTLSPSPDPSKFVNVVASAPCSVDLLVF